MPLTTKNEAKLEMDSGNTGGSLSQSGYDVVTSAASPQQSKRPERWDLFILYNVAIPILLVLVGVAIVRVLGKAEAAPLPPPDTSPAAVLESLPETEVHRILSLSESEEQLELVIDGTVVPFREAAVSSEVSGRVIKKSESCEAGGIVKAGEVLMQIDPKDYELEVERLTRLREQEYRALGEIDQEMLNAKRSIEVAQEDVALKRNEVKRQTDLGSFASKAEIDQAKSALLRSSQELLTLQNQLDLLRSRRSRLEASEQLAATQLSVAELNLERCQVVAPISGVIVSEQADLNTFVSRGTPLVTIEDTTKVEVSANMRMDQLHWVMDKETTENQSGYDLPDTDAIIEYEVAGRLDTVHRWRGKLVSYDGVGIDPATRTVPVRILVDNPMQYWDDAGEEKMASRTTALLRGMYVRVRLQLSPQSELIVIPAKALRPGNRVWVFSPDDAVLQQKIKETEEIAEQASEAARDAEASSQTEDEEAADALVDKKPFDPTGWKSGLVKYSSSVYPIDSLRLRRQPTDESDVSGALQSEGKRWVCEAGKSDVSSGDYVVVSPLDSIPPDGLPARAKIEP